MNVALYGVYLTALTVGMLTPGPAMLQALGLGLRHGPGPVAVVALGNVCVSILQVVAALYGLSLLTAWPAVLRLAGWAGAAYMGWLGWRLWRAGPGTGTAPARNAAAGPGALFAQGALVAMVNPKAWASLAALMPPFAAGGAPEATTVALLAAPLCLLAFGGMLAYGCLGARIGDLLGRPTAARRILRAMAAILWLCALSLIRN